MSVECKYCEQDARRGHAKGCIAEELYRAKELLREAASGSWLSSYPGGGALSAYDEARAALKDRA